VRSVLKSAYYSRTVRALAYAPLDAFESVTGRRDAMTPPRRLQYVGRGEDFDSTGAFWRHRLVDEHGLRPDGAVLDIGCGVGRTAVALCPHLTEGFYEGFDIVPQFIRWCRRRITPRYPNFRFQLADVRNRQYNRAGGVPADAFEFPYPADSFDIAFAASVFTHMRPNEIRRYMSEASRVLRPGGVLLASLFAVDSDVEELIAGGRSAFRLDHELRDSRGNRFLATDDRVPEYCIGIDASDAERFAGEVGLEPEGSIRPGWWSGRPGTEGAAYQDLLVLRAGAAE
jgi:SAM-dependent methyltransferase